MENQSPSDADITGLCEISLRESRDKAITVYRPNLRRELGIFQTWTMMSRNIWRSRELIWQLFKRDFLAAYKKSFIGFTWIFIAPLLGIVQWVFLQKTGMLNPGDLDIPYPVYILIGTSMWGLFMGFYGSAASTLSSGSSLVMQVNYPHEVLLFKQAAQQVTNFLIVFVLNIIVMICYRITPNWGICVFPLVALPLFFLGAAIGLMVAMINVVAVDVSRLINMGMGLLLLGTPVVYSNRNPAPFLSVILKWNPLTYLICSCRDIIIKGELYYPELYFVCAGASLVVFMISWRLFYVSEHKLIERMI